MNNVDDVMNALGKTVIDFRRQCNENNRRRTARI